MASSDGQSLAAIMAEVSGSTQTIRAIAKKWSQAAESCGQQTGTVTKAADEGRQGWTGSTAAAFESSMAQFAAASRNEQSCFHQAAEALDSAAAALDEAQATVSGIHDRLTDEVNMIARELELGGGATASAFENAVSQLTAEATSQAQEAASQAERTLTEVHTTLTGLLRQMKGSKAFSALYVPTKKGFTAPPPPYKNTPLDNAKLIYAYLREHGYSSYGAAGVVACIYGESSLNPEAVGTGGWGLIGWTPQYPGEYADLYPTGNAEADLQKQLPALLQYNNGWSQYLPMLNSATSVQQAADIYSQYFERPEYLYSDVHPEGISIAEQVSGH